MFSRGCLTGANHSGAKLHGFLAYLMRWGATGIPYTVFGYKGKPLRDNIHRAERVQAFHHSFRAPRRGEVYNMGGGRFSNCSMLEAIECCQEITGRESDWEYVPDNRIGDHIRYISGLSRFKDHYPNGSMKYDVPSTLEEIFEFNKAV